jgi:hypothetical protein
MTFDWDSFVDWFTVASAAATVVALILAVIAIQTSARLARADTLRVIESRYVQLHISLLIEVLDLVNEGRSDSAHLERWRAIHSRLRILDAGLPLTRIVFGVGRTARERADLLGIPAEVDVGDDTNLEELDRPRGGRIRDSLFDEIVASIADLGIATTGELANQRETAQARRSQESEFVALREKALGHRNF